MFAESIEEGMDITKSKFNGNKRKPVIIYTEEPKVIHVHAHDFKAVVQKLTGQPNTALADQREPAMPVAKKDSNELKISQEDENIFLMSRHQNEAFFNGNENDFGRSMQLASKGFSMKDERYLNEMIKQDSIAVEGTSCFPWMDANFIYYK